MNKRCGTCGCTLQTPDYPRGEGSIWLTPWHDCGGHCVVCMAHAGDPDCIDALHHWLDLSAVPDALDFACLCDAPPVVPGRVGNVREEDA